MRWLKKTYPFLKWVISFADATQCGDGTIYRASGFVLTGIKKNTQIWEAPTGEIFNDTSIQLRIGRARAQAKSIISRTTHTKAGHILETGASSMRIYKEAGWKPKAGFQLRYICFLDPLSRLNLTVPIIPFSEIEKRGARMYLGKPRGESADSGTPVPTGRGGANPTSPLKSKKARHA
jgi:hypothetical protein